MKVSAVIAIYIGLLVRAQGFVVSVVPFRGRPFVAPPTQLHSVAAPSSISVAQDWNETLASYGSNLGRATTKDAYYTATKSLSALLRQYTMEEEDRGIDNSINLNLLTPVVVAALRCCAKHNDYKTILELFQSLEIFCETNCQTLDRRLVGKTLSSLQQTSCSFNKLQTVFRRSIDDDYNCWTPSNTTTIPSTLEVNAMLKSCLQHSKTKKALEYFDLYRNVSDAYSLCFVLQCLEQSLLSSSSSRQVKRPILTNPILNHCTSGSCWQWNQALCYVDTLDDVSILNNPVVSELLELNRLAAAQSHNGGRSETTKHLLQYLETINFEMDAQTCTRVQASLDWQASVQFLNDCRRDSNNNKPPPNIYMYGATMAVCAQARQYKTTLQLLQSILQRENDLQPNTIVFNNALHSLRGRSAPRKLKPTHVQQCQERLRAAFTLLGDMELSGVPLDAITFHSFLRVVANTHSVVDWKSVQVDFSEWFGSLDDTIPFVERLVFTILDQMKKREVPCDVVTYQNCMECLGDFGSIQRLLAMLNRTTTCAAELYDLALNALAKMGDTEGVCRLLSDRNRARIASDSKTTLHVINTLGRGSFASSLPAFLRGELEETDPLFKISSQYCLDLCELVRSTSLEAHHFSAAMSWALQSKDFDTAKQILLHMKAVGFRPSNESLQEISRAYARMALTPSGVQSSALQTTEAVHRHANVTAAACAKTAFKILTTVQEPSSSLITLVSKACGATGRFRESESLLRLIHARILNDKLRKPNQSSRAERSLPGLHRSLLRYCAIHGNVTNALRICEDIQSFKTRVLERDTDRSDHFAGMGINEWKSLLVAASKSGHWRVCLSTLQFVRPHVEATHLRHAKTDFEMERSRREYERLEIFIKVAMKCLAVRSQYGWIVRGIDDWIEWSGRRPPSGAVSAALRRLASRGRGDEVNNLLSRCTLIPSSRTKGDDDLYEISLYVCAITALYQNGLYDEADEAFLAALSKGRLQLKLDRRLQGQDPTIALDLHGMNIAMAHSAVRIALHQETAASIESDDKSKKPDMVIVTGRGLNSALSMRPVLRPEVQRMLMEEFYPPLSSSSVPGNMGALRVTATDISGWLDHQQSQKDARMLMAAQIIKGIVSDSVHAVFKVV